MLDFVAYLLGDPPALVGSVVGLLGVPWALSVVARQRRGRPVPPIVVVAPLLALVVLLPVGGWWTERLRLSNLSGVPEDQLLWAWRSVEEAAWGRYPIGIAVYALPTAGILLVGLRGGPNARNPARTAWAIIVTTCTLGLLASSGLAAIELLVAAALASVLLRGAWVLTHDAASDTERVAQRTTAATLATIGALVVTGVVATGHIHPSHNVYSLVQEPRGAQELRRAAAHATLWREGLLVAAVLCYPLLTAGIRSRSLLALTLPAVALPLAIAEPSWVRARPVPPIPAPAPIRPEHRIEIVEVPPPDEAPDAGDPVRGE